MMADRDLLPRPGARVLVWGFGRHGGGLAAARFCAGLGARVEILDQQPAERLGPAAAEAAAQGWPWYVGDGSHPALTQAELVVASPAIAPRTWPSHHPPRTCPEGLFFAAHRGQRLAVSGTKGKSTTARIAGELLGWAVAGNSYEPLLDHLLRHGPEAPVVCELSSFQLWYLAQHRPPRFAAAILTSLAVDHLDWHPDLAHYHASKLALLDWADATVVDPAVGLPPAPGRITPTLLTATDPPGFADALGPLAQRSDLGLVGDHNVRNAALAIAAACHLGCPRDQIAPRLRQVRALPHRLELVAERNGIAWRNDSIATTPESAMAALAALSGPLAIILGGSDKGADFQALARAVATRGAIPLLIGSTAPRLAESLRHAGIEPVMAGTLAQATALARDLLPTGGTILLSPACASFDQFRGFEDRGEQFRALAQIPITGATPERTAG